MRLYLIRHAESQGNFEGRLQGTKEFPITKRGREQSRALADRLAGLGVDAIYASPMQRTMQTAELVAERLGLPVVPEPRLQEYDFGAEISGLTWEAIRKQHPAISRALAKEDTDFPRYPGEEGRAAFSHRVREAMGEILEAHKTDEAVAIITHAGPIVAYVLQTLGRNYSRPVPFAIDNASITTVEIGEPRAFAPAVVTGINDTCHVRQSLAQDRRLAADLGPRGR